MNKIFALYKNELIKTSRKISVLIILIIMIVGVFAMGGLFKFIGTMSNQVYSSSDNGSMDEWNKQDTQSQIANFEGSLQENQTQLDNLSDTPDNQMQRASLEEEKSYLTDQIDIYKLALDNKIYLNSTYTYLTMMLNEIHGIKSEIR